jgi:hypothetical protein
MSSEYSFNLSFRRMQTPTTFAGGFEHSFPMARTACELSDAYLSSSGMGEKISMAIRGWVAPWSILSTPKSSHRWKETISLCTITRWNRRCLLFNDHSQRAGFTWNEKLPFALGATWVDLGSASSPTWNLQVITANLGSERAWFLSDLGHRAWALVYLWVLAFDEMDPGVRWDSNEGKSDEWYEKRSCW